MKVKGDFIYFEGDAALNIKHIQVVEFGVDLHKDGFDMSAAIHLRGGTVWQLPNSKADELEAWFEGGEVVGDADVEDEDE